jgi:hypothetical protein
MERGLTPEAADFWMGKQWAVEKKAQACDQVLWNEGSLALLRDQVERLADPEGGGRQPADRRSEKAKL